MVESSTKATNVEHDDSIDLNGIVAAFRRRFGAFLAVAIVVFSTIVVLTFQITPKYTATASVAIELRKTDVADIREVLSGLPPDSAAVKKEHTTPPRHKTTPTSRMIFPLTHSLRQFSIRKVLRKNSIGI